MAGNKQKTKLIKKPSLKGLTPKQKKFCREYIYDWNATRSYLKAYPKTKNEANAASMASRMLRIVKVRDYIEEIQKDLEKVAGISKLWMINEHLKIVQGTIARLHNTWIKRKEFEDLTEEQKSCIAEIDTKIKTEFEYNSVSEEKEPISVEYVKIKLYDKQKALDALTKLFGYEAPSKTELTGKDGKDLIPPARILTKEEAKEFLNSLENGC
jgi:phage terminase small subunit